MTTTNDIKELYALFKPGRPGELVNHTEFSSNAWEMPLGTWVCSMKTMKWINRQVVKRVNKDPRPAWLNKKPEEVPEHLKLQILLLSP